MCSPLFYESWGAVGAQPLRQSPAVAFVALAAHARVPEMWRVRGNVPFQKVVLPSLLDSTIGEARYQIALMAGSEEEAQAVRPGRRCARRQ